MSEDMPRAKMVSDDEILAQFSEVESPVVTVSDIAERVDLSADAIRLRLKAMEDEGRVRSMTVGSRAVVWWRVD